MCKLSMKAAVVEQCQFPYDFETVEDTLLIKRNSEFSLIRVCDFSLLVYQQSKE